MPGDGRSIALLHGRASWETDQCSPARPAAAGTHDAVLMSVNGKSSPLHSNGMQVTACDRHPDF